MDKVQKDVRSEPVSEVQEVFAYIDRLAQDKMIPHYVKTELRNLIEKLARTDALTGCLKKDYLYREMDRALNAVNWDHRRPDRRSEWLCLWSIDLGNFKLINDSMGHLVGDKVLEAVGQILISSIRHLEGVDFASRPGGDEFAALLTDVTDVEGAFKSAKRFQRNLADKAWEQIDERLTHLTPRADIGCVCLHTDCIDVVSNEEEIQYIRMKWYEQADLLMYKSKNQSGHLYSRIMEYNRSQRKLVDAEGRYYRQKVSQDRRGHQ